MKWSDVDCIINQGGHHRLVIRGGPHDVSIVQEVLSQDRWVSAQGAIHFSRQFLPDVHDALERQMDAEGRAT